MSEQSSPEDVSPALRTALRRVGAFSTDQGIEVYVVGGFVRDRLLGRQVTDLDLVWLGPGEPAEISLAWGASLRSEVTYHRDFMTASCEVDGVRMDLARARAETYAAPAALPQVRPSGLADDLVRRDYSINAVAWPLASALRNPASREEAIDPCDGLADLDQRVLRVMHARSFEDDPTRVLRGLELRARLGFDFDSETLELARHSLDSGAFARLSGARLRHEFARLFARWASYEAAAVGLRELRIDRGLDSRFRIDDAAIARVRSLGERLAVGGERAAAISGWSVALALLAWREDAEIRSSLADRLALKREARRLLVDGPERTERTLAGIAAVDWVPMDVVASGDRLSTSELGLLDMLVGPEGAARMAELRSLLAIRLAINGDDLLRADATPGPRIGEALERVLAARRAGEIGPEAELEYALDWLDESDGPDDH